MLFCGCNVNQLQYDIRKGVDGKVFLFFALISEQVESFHLLILLAEQIQMNINLIFGDEFWKRLNDLSTNATKRIFLLSAYIGKVDWEKVVASTRDNVSVISMCRTDSSYRPTINTFLIDKDIYHGKLYVVDNVVLIGSKNLCNANKNGEFSVEFCADSEDEASLIVYQALLKTIENSTSRHEPVDKAFLKFYEDDSCPFCGGNQAELDSIIECSEYGGNFVSEDDCDSYGNEGACKYCIPENRHNLGTCYVCDHSGCGFGIQESSGKLLYHEFVEHDPLAIESAKKYLALFNYFAHQNPELAVEFFKLMGFTGDIFKISSKRLKWRQCSKV